MRYVLNSAVITAPGRYSYRLVSEKEAANWLRQGPFMSRVGYHNTAKHIQNISGIKPEVNREATAMLPGDEALVVRLKYRVQNPGEKATYQPGANDWEYGILQLEGFANE